MRYKTLEGFDNKKVKIYGKDEYDLFENGPLGLANLLCLDVEKGEKLIRGFEVINIEAKNTKKLLEDFLNKILALSLDNSKIYPKTKILKFSSTSVKAHVSGFKYEPIINNGKKIIIEEIIKNDSGRFSAVVLIAS